MMLTVAMSAAVGPKATIMTTYSFSQWKYVSLVLTKEIWTFSFLAFQGAVDFKNGDRFEGDFYHNEIQGIGELRCVSGLMYKGEWRHSKVSRQTPITYPYYTANYMEMHH